MTSRSISAVFDEYEKARLKFVQTISNLAQKPQHVANLKKLNVINLLKKLLSGDTPQITQCASVALARLIQNSTEIACTVINDNILQILLNTPIQNKYQKRGILSVIRSLCKADPQIAKALIDLHALTKLTEGLEDFDTQVKESALCSIGHIARHGKELARSCVDFGVLPLVILCLQEPELPLKQVAAGTLSEIAKHSTELGQDVADGGAIAYLAKNLNNPDEKLKRLILSALSSCAKHSTELAETVVEAEVFPSVVQYLCNPCPLVRREAAKLIENVVKHSLELTQLVVNCGGIGALIETIKLPPEESRIPCIAALGYIAGHSDQLAISIINCNAIAVLNKILHETIDDSTLCATVWTLGNIGRFTPEHAQSIAEANIFPRWLDLFMSPASSEDLKLKCRLALKVCLQKCLVMDALAPLLYNAPSEILKYALCQYSKKVEYRNSFRSRMLDR